MSKKIISLLLTLMLTVSMVAVAAVSVSAEVDDQGRYTPSEGVPTNRYYFYMPSDWYNDCAFDAGIYWWLGSDAPSAWPGYGAQNADATQVYYCDVPEDSSTIIWNNGFDGGNDATDPDYAKAIQTVDIASQFYSDGDSDIYDSEFFAEMEASYNGDKAALGSFADNFFYDEEYGLGFSFNYDNMIYVINPNMVSENPLSGKITSGGEWYFYYGNGEYGKYPTKEESVEKGTLYSSDYQPAKESPETEPATDASSTATDISETTTATVSTDVTEPTTVSTPYLTVNATSNYFPKATAEYNEATNEVTVTYFMKSSKNLLDTQWNLYYDSSVLSVSSKNTAESICPSIGDYAVFNLGLDGVIKYNATNLKLFDFTSEEKAYVSVIFDVKDISESAPVTTTVDLDVNVLRVSKIDPSTLRSDYNEEVMLCNFSEVLENDETKTVQVDRRTELTPSTYVEPTTVETTVVETTTVKPTEEPTEATDVTEETVAPETTVPETTVPDTTAEPEPTVPNLTVTATSNFFPKATAEYKKSTNEVVVTYWLKSDMNVLDLQWYLTYDSEILTLSENTNEDTVCPVIGDKAVMNTGLKNKIKYNATNLYLFDFSSAETPFAQFTFNVNDLTGKAPATTTIDLNVEVLRVSEINEETLRSDNDKEVILVDNSVIVSDDVIESVGIKKRTVLTPSTFIAPTTAEPETTEPTEPETTVPSEPETTEPTEPETTVPAEPETTEPTEPETTVPAEPETTEPAEPETTVPAEPETTVPVEPETTEPAEPETTVPAEPETTEPAEPETTAPAEPETTAPAEPESTEPAEPETTEPAEPETTEPSTSEPEASTAVETTTEATTSFVDPAASQEVTTIAPATDSTSATGATGSKSTGDTPTSTGGNNGTVQTGDASLAVIILSILVGATCVMFVLRKREMF